MPGSGKSTIILQLVGGQSSSPQTAPVDTPPTRNADLTAIRVGRCKIAALELPGGTSARERWVQHLGACQAVVVVVDSSDDIRLPALALELEFLLPAISRLSIPMLLLASKQDLPGALSKRDLLTCLKLEALLMERSIPLTWTMCECTTLDPHTITHAAKLLLELCSVHGAEHKAAPRRWQFPFF